MSTHGNIGSRANECTAYRQAYVLFKSPQAATAAKHKIESFGEGQQYTKKFTVSYTSPHTNPFRTLPKDGPMRNSNAPNNNRSTSGNYGNTGAMSNIPPQQMGFNMNGPSNSYRGNRGGYNNRGGGMNSMPSYNRGGFQQSMTGGFPVPQMGGFQGSPMSGMPPYGGFQNRGGIGGMRGGAMNMRGGRGGMSATGMMGMPMGNMGMGVIGAQMNGMAMGMPQMGAAMGMQGMQVSYNNFYVNLAESQPSSVILARPRYASSPPAGQYVSSPIPAGHCSSPERDANAFISAGGTSSNSRPPPSHRPTWAPLTRYLPLVPSHDPAHFPSHPVPTASSISYAHKQNGMLNGRPSHTGPVGFPGAQPHYNPAFFPQAQQQQSVGAGDTTWNPHGAKRTRQE